MTALDKAVRPRSAWRAVAAGRWQALAPRERVALSVAAWVVGAVAVWWVGIKQPLNQGQAAQQRLAALLDQQAVMQRQAAEAQALKATAAVPTGQAPQALQAATARLAPRGRLVVQGDRAVLTVDGASSTELQAWWAEARAGARAQVTELQLARTERGLSGTVTVQLGGTP